MGFCGTYGKYSSGFGFSCSQALVRSLASNANRLAVICKVQDGNMMFFKKKDGTSQLEKLIADYARRQSPNTLNQVLELFPKIP